MQLRKRVFLMVAAVALVSGLMAYLAIDSLLVGSYRQLEESAVRTTAEHARRALQGELQALDFTASDWAHWDELHNALGDAAKARAFIANNFAPLTFSGLGVSHIAVIERDGQVRVAAGYDPATRTLRALSDDYVAMLVNLQRALHASGEEQLSAVVRSSAGVEIVAIRPVRPFTFEAASRGDVVVARAVDVQMAERMATLLRCDFAFLPADAVPVPEQPLWLDFVDDHQAWGLFRIQDIDGNLALVGRVGVPRDIHAQAQSTLGLVTLVLAVIILMAPVLAELIMDRVVVARVRGLRDWASAVAAGGALAPPAAVGGRDEIGDLTQSIGSMATHLDGVQKDLEQAREQADRANRAKSEFLAGASHEIRTPLTAILGYAELLQDRRLGDEEYARYLATIRDNGEELLGILNDVLDLSKVEAGRLDLSWEKTDIRAVLLGVIALLELKAGERGLTLSVEGADELPARAFIDPARFRQILVNLIGNAVRYTDHGGVVIRCRVEHPGPVNARLFVAVHDTGIGMDATQLARLFRPFTQLGYGHARRTGGTGLGLALSQEFARAMGGSIRVQSTPGAGSVFTLELPLGDLTGVPLAGTVPVLPPALPEESVADHETFPGARVLLVEDNAVNCLLVEKLLEKLAVAVHTENDGMAALDHLLKSGEHYDLVLLDMRLPSLDGYAIARRLRAAEYRGTVVALTASAMSGERERALGAGCDDFIAKPLQARAFLRTCRDWLRRRVSPG